MQELTHLLRGLRRLNELQARPLAPWAASLTERERDLAVEQARLGLPTYLLGHHDRLVARGKRSLAVVRNGVCGACHIRLPLGHQHPAARGGDLDVCDNCGVFLEWEVCEVPVEVVKPAAKRGRPSHKSSGQHSIAA